MFCETWRSCSLTETAQSGHHGECSFMGHRSPASALGRRTIRQPMMIALGKAAIHRRL